MVGNYDKAELKNIKLVENGGSYFLDVTYEYENKYGIYKLNIPKIHLPIMTNRIPAYVFEMSPRSYQPYLTVDLGFGELDVMRDFETGFTHKITEIEKKTHKMTVAEIEAALGYKVEIVSK